MDRTELDRKIKEIFDELEQKRDEIYQRYKKRGGLDGGGKEEMQLIREAIAKKDKLIKEFNEKHS